jgi:predicted  nucleic acid-binding Zn-ribbon protein
MKTSPWQRLSHWWAVAKLKWKARGHRRELASLQAAIVKAEAGSRRKASDVGARDSFMAESEHLAVQAMDLKSSLPTCQQKLQQAEAELRKKLSEIERDRKSTH